jgi:hypothetical protein
MGPRARSSLFAVCGIMGGWVGHWIGQSTVSVRYWIAPLAASTGGSDFAWWSKYVDLPAEVRRRLAYLADQQMFAFWRFLLSIGLAVLFACVAALVITRLPAWRARQVLQNGIPAEATVARVVRTGEEVRGPAGVERQWRSRWTCTGRAARHTVRGRPSSSANQRGWSCSRERGYSCAATRSIPSEWPSWNQSQSRGLSSQFAPIRTRVRDDGRTRHELPREEVDRPVL